MNGVLQNQQGVVSVKRRAEGFTRRNSMYRHVDTIDVMVKSSELKIQKWGNSLALRIPSSIARRAGFHAGQPVRVSLQDSSVLVSLAGEPELSLGQKLAMFDPQVHGGETMISERTGREAF